MTALKLTSAALALVVGGTAAQAQDWWPFEINAAKNGNLETVETIAYQPLEKASKPWNLCVVVPHMQDSYWVAIDHGLVDAAKRQGVRMTVYQAGGYANLPRQVAQYDDCMASGADAILIGAISEAGMAAKITEGMDKGIVNIALANPVLETPITARITPDYYQKGYQGALYAGETLGEGASAIAFPGPQGSGWAETYLQGFVDGAAEAGISVAAEYFGEASVPAQLRLVEDALMSNPDVTMLWGGAPAAEAAVGALADAGMDGDVSIFASYENQTMLSMIEDGKVQLVATEYPVMIGEISVDLAIRALEGEPYEQVLLVAPGLVTADNIAEYDTTQIFAPEGTQPVFSVE